MINKNISTINKENLYNSKVLMHNWFEDKSSNSNNYSYLVKPRNDDSNILLYEKFNKTSNNVINFQPHNTVKTTYLYGN